jgi:hypothetical protein
LVLDPLARFSGVTRRGPQLPFKVPKISLWSYQPRGDDG